MSPTKVHHKARGYRTAEQDAEDRVMDYLGDLLADVARALRTSPGVIMSTSRESQAAHARQVVAYVLRAQGMTLPAIGRTLGRDHSTVIHAIRRVQATPRLYDVALPLVLKYAPA